MGNRWIILAVLFTVRTVMGIHFQSVASFSPFLIEDLDIDYTRLGILIGLYHLPGVVLAFPGGLLGKRFGDKRVAMSGLVLMTIGALIASFIWMLFNVGFISLPSFGPDLLTSIGYTVTAAGSMVSMVTWIIVFSVQFGGYISEKIRRPNIILVTCFVGISLGMFLLPYGAHPITLFVLLGLIFGPPAGIIMALPAEVLQPENRAAGMGLFYSFYYGGMTALTSLAGYSRDLTQNAATPILFGGVLLIIAIIILVIFRALQARISPIPAEVN